MDKRDSQVLSLKASRSPDRHRHRAEKDVLEREARPWTQVQPGPEACRDQVSVATASRWHPHSAEFPAPRSLGPGKASPQVDFSWRLPPPEHLGWARRSARCLGRVSVSCPHCSLRSSPHPTLVQAEVAEVLQFTGGTTMAACRLIQKPVS